MKSPAPNDSPAADTSPVFGILANPTRFLFFTGKGGVGKTSLSAATAIAHRTDMTDRRTNKDLMGSRVTDEDVEDKEARPHAQHRVEQEEADLAFAKHFRASSIFSPILGR